MKYSNKHPLKSKRKFVITNTKLNTIVFRSILYYIPVVSFSPNDLKPNRMSGKTRKLPDRTSISFRRVPEIPTSTPLSFSPTYSNLTVTLNLAYHYNSFTWFLIFFKSFVALCVNVLALRLFLHITSLNTSFCEFLRIFCCFSFCLNLLFIFYSAYMDPRV